MSGSVTPTKPFGIPTVYAGIQFRSRLEARWAAFFDQCGWRWEYEPFDLPGWIPDFMLEGRVAVEVKPFTRPAEWFGQWVDIWKAFDESGSFYETALLGTSPFDMKGFAAIGYSIWGYAPILVSRNQDNSLDLFDLDRRGTLISQPVREVKVVTTHSACQAMWANACNLTQYKGRQNR